MTRNRRLLLTLVAAIGAPSFYVSAFGLYPRAFDIAWKEELQLSSGRILLVNVKQTYERRGLRLSKYDDAIFRSNEITFDAGTAVGRLKFASRLGIRLLDQVAGDWYLVLFGQGPYGNHSDEMPDRWGRDFTVQEERLAKLQDGQFQPVSWDAAPPNTITKANFVVGSIPVSVLAEYQAKVMTLDEKKKLLTEYPPGPDAETILRPIRMTVKGEAK